MDYFSKFLRPAAATSPKQTHDHATEFHRAWVVVKVGILHSGSLSVVPDIQCLIVICPFVGYVDASR